MGKFPNPRHGERLLSGDVAAHCTIGTFRLSGSIDVVWHPCRNGRRFPIAFRVETNGE